MKASRRKRLQNAEAVMRSDLFFRRRGTFLSAGMQEALLDACGMQDCTPSLSQAVKLRRMAAEGTLTARKIQDIMREPKANQRDRLTFRADTFAQFFPKSYTAEQMEQEILRLLKQRQERSRDRDVR